MALTSWTAKGLARYAAVARAQAIARTPEQRRIATLLAFAHLLEATAQDDALDVLDILVENVLDKANTMESESRCEPCVISMRPPYDSAKPASSC